MSLFTPAEVTSAYLKMGIMGFAGSGKTYTATVTATGLVSHMRDLKVAAADRPLFFLDTETGSDWVKPKIEKAGIALYTAKTRAFTDLLTAVREAEKASSLLLVDSITHFWIELCDSYMKAKKRTRLQFDDWGFLKGEWRKFTDLFVNSNLHIILCGRAGNEYDYFEDEAGKKQLEKTDIKMKAEGEMGYEPSLLVLMERHTDMETMKAYRTAIRCRLAGVRVSSATTINSRLRFANIDCEMRFTNDRAGDTLELVPRIRTSAGRSKPSRPLARLPSIARKSVGCALIAHSWPSLWLR